MRDDDEQFLILMVAATQGGGVYIPTTPGNELWVQPAFDAATGITLNGWSVTAGEARAPASTSFMAATALETLTTGSYQVILDISVNPDGTAFQVNVGGGGNATSSSAIGPQTLSVNVVSVTDQLIRIRDNNGDGSGDKITALSVKKLS